MKPFRLSPDGDCLSEFGMILLHQRLATAKKVEKKVQTMEGIKKRKFVPIKIERVIGGKVLPAQSVWADWVTGTLYDTDGDCLSSTKMRLIK